MLTVLTPAYERLSELLADRPEDVAVRVVLERGRARIRPGRERQGDEVIKHGGRTVLLLDERAARYVDQRTIGVRDTDNGPRLRLQRKQTQQQIRSH